MSKRSEWIQQHIVRLAEDKGITRDNLALFYAFAIAAKDDPGIDWGLPNDAIRERWSMAGLVYIKTEAWKLVNETRSRLSREAMPNAS